MVSLFGRGFDSLQLHFVKLKNLTNDWLMDWMNIGATVLLVIIGIAIYIHKKKDEE